MIQVTAPFKLFWAIFTCFKYAKPTAVNLVRDIDYYKQ